MKKTKIWFGLLSFLALGACEISEIESKKSNCTYYDYESSTLWQSTVYPENEAEELHDKMLYYTNTIIAEMMNLGTFKSELLNKGNYDANNEATLQWFMENVNGFSTHFESQLNVLSSCVDTAISYDQLLGNMNISGVQYYPVIYYYNLNYANDENSYYIALGAEADSLDRYTSLYVNNSVDSITEVLISEKDSTFDQPILIITNGTDYVTEIEFSEDTIQSKPSGGSPKAYAINIDKYQINERFERTGNSYLTLTYYAFSSTTWNFQNERDVNQIPANKMNYLYTDDINWYWPLGPTIYGFAGYTFERDWGTSRKPALVDQGNGSPSAFVMYGRRKFTWEWYNAFVQNTYGSVYVSSSNVKGKFYTKQ